MNYYRTSALFGIMVFLSLLSNGASAKTYTCTEVTKKAVLAYDGKDTVTDNHSDGKCTWTIGDATCSGCRRADFQLMQSMIRGLYRNSPSRAPIYDYFPSLVIAAKQLFGIDISNEPLQDIKCHENISRDFNFNKYSDRARYSNAEISCIYKKLYPTDPPFIIGETIIQTNTERTLLIISVKGDGWSDEMVSMYVRVY